MRASLKSCRKRYHPEHLPVKSSHGSSYQLSELLMVSLSGSYFFTYWLVSFFLRFVVLPAGPAMAQQAPRRDASQDFLCLPPSPPRKQQCIEAR